MIRHIIQIRRKPLSEIYVNPSGRWRHQLLPMLKAHRNCQSWNAYVWQETAHISRSSRIQRNYIELNFYMKLKRCGGREKIWKQLLNAMNATLSQNVVVISYNEVPPTNITEQVQLKNWSFQIVDHDDPPVFQGSCQSPLLSHWPGNHWSDPRPWYLSCHLFLVKGCQRFAITGQRNKPWGLYQPLSLSKNRLHCRPFPWKNDRRSLDPQPVAFSHEEHIHGTKRLTAQTNEKKEDGPHDHPVSKPPGGENVVPPTLPWNEKVE